MVGMLPADDEGVRSREGRLLEGTGLSGGGAVGRVPDVDTENPRVVAMDDLMQLNPGYNDPSSDYAACLHAAGGSRVRALELYAELLEGAAARVRAVAGYGGEIAVASVGEVGFRALEVQDPDKALRMAVAVAEHIDDGSVIVCVAPVTPAILAEAFSRLEVLLGRPTGWVFLGVREHADLRAFQNVLDPETRQPFRDRGVMATLWGAQVVILREPVLSAGNILVASRDGSFVVKVSVIH